VRVPCEKGNGTHRSLDSAVDLGPGEEVPQQQDDAPACHMLQEVQQNSAKTSDSRW